MKQPYFCNTLVVIIIITSTTWQVALAQDAESQPLLDLIVTIVDEAGEPVRGVLVGTTRREWEHSGGVLRQDVPASLIKWYGNASRAVPLITDTQGRVSLRGDDVFKPYHESRAIYAQDPAGGRAAVARITRDDLGTILHLRLEPACLILGDFNCKTLDVKGIPLFETISYLNWEDIQLLLTHHSSEKRCAFMVPPGEYTLRMSGYGKGIPVSDAGGAPTDEIKKTVVVKPGQRLLDLGTIELQLTAQGFLVGDPAPPLGNIALWKNTEPFTLADQRGKVVVLLFWSRGCGSTPATVAWLGGIHEHLKDRGLEVLAIHEADPEMSDLAGFDRHALPLIEETAAEHNDELYPSRTSKTVPIAVAGGDGLGDAYTAYHVNKWPTGILIDRQGNVRHIFQYGLDYKVIERALDVDE